MFFVRLFSVVRFRTYSAWRQQNSALPSTICKATEMASSIVARPFSTGKNGVSHLLPEQGYTLLHIVFCTMTFIPTPPFKKPVVAGKAPDRPKSKLY